MDSASDSLILSYKDNPELKSLLADYQPGDQVELCVTVTVRDNNTDKFDSLIDEVEPMDDTGGDEEETPEEEASETPADEAAEDKAEGDGGDAAPGKKPAAVLLVMGAKKKGNAGK